MAGNCGEASGRETPWRGCGLRGAAASLPEWRHPRPAPQLRAPLYGAPRGPLQVGDRSGGGGESRGRPGPRAARSACAPRSALGSGYGARGRAGCFGRRAKLIVRQVRGRPATGRAAKVGGGRAGGGGRRTRARLVVGVSIFFSKTPLGRAGVLSEPPGPPGTSGRRRRPQTRACERRVPCNLSVLLLPSQ